MGPDFVLIMIDGWPAAKAQNGDVGECGFKDVPIAVVAAGEAAHNGDGAASVVFGPSVVGVSAKDVDSTGPSLDLALEGHGASTVEFAHFEAEQVVIPPGGFGGV